MAQNRVEGCDLYSGLFFRAEGKESAKFGQIQEQQTQSIEVIASENPGQITLGPIKIAENYNPTFIGTA